MDQIIGGLNYCIENNNSKEDALKAIFETHIQFEKIHHFSDDNGRKGRIVINYFLLENDFPPLILKKDNRNEYIKILGEAQMQQFPD